MAVVSPQELIGRAYRLAVGTSSDATVQPILDNIWAFEEAYPHALRQASSETARSADEIEKYRRQHTLAVVDGTAALPDAVLDEFLDSSTIYSDADPTIAELSSFAPRWSSFQRPVHDMLHYYTFKEGDFFFREAGGDLNVWDGDIELVCVSMPDIPAAISGTSEVPSDIAERTIQILAGMIKGRS